MSNSRDAMPIADNITVLKPSSNKKAQNKIPKPPPAMMKINPRIEFMNPALALPEFLRYL
jgi:hypothetical protein